MIAVSLLAVGCKKSTDTTATGGSATPTPTPHSAGSGSATTPTPTPTPTPAAGSGSAAPAPTAGAAVDPAAKAAVDKIKVAALELCTKGLDAVKATDLKTNDQLVASFGHPQDPGFDSSKDADYSWLATKAAVVQSDDDSTLISIVNDDTDPCAIKPYANLMTSKGNPAAQIKLDSSPLKTGDFLGWVPGAGATIHIGFGGMRGDKYNGASFDGPQIVKFTKVEAGKSVELDFHGCWAQSSALMGKPPVHFAIGHIAATWCAK